MKETISRILSQRSFQPRAGKLQYPEREHASQREMENAVVEMKQCPLSKRKRHHMDEDHRIHLRATLQQQSYYENVHLLIYRTIRVCDKVLSSLSHSETGLGPFAVVLQSLDLDLYLLKLQIHRNYCV